LTILTPTFVQLQTAKINGAAGGPIHISNPHEPTREGENPVILPAPAVAAAPPNSVAPTTAPQPLKIALIGTAPSSRMLAPFGDPSWQIWGCSPGNMNALPRVSIWFELHSNLLWPEYESYGRPYIEWLKAQAFPVYMQDQALVERATTFPMRDMVAEFGQDFFTSSFAWMMALAIKMGATEIALYGIDMASRDEYIRQRPGFYFFKHQAEKRGIKVSAPHESDIMQSPPLYAYVDSTPFGRKIRARTVEIEQRLGPMQQQHGQLGNNITYLQGAKEDLDYFESIWSGVSNEMSILRYDNAALKQRVVELEAEAAKLKGAVFAVAVEPPTDSPPLQLKVRRRRKKMMDNPAVIIGDGPHALEANDG
jgi:hypothetical protein